MSEYGVLHHILFHKLCSKNYVYDVYKLWTQFMNWRIAQAKQKFSQLISAVRQEPQLIYNRDQLVAAVIEAKMFQQFLAWQQVQQKPSFTQTFAELARLCAEEDYHLEVTPRQNRLNPFVDDLENVSL